MTLFDGHMARQEMAIKQEGRLLPEIRARYPELAYIFNYFEDLAADHAAIVDALAHKIDRLEDDQVVLKEDASALLCRLKKTGVIRRSRGITKTLAADLEQTLNNLRDDV